jgi:4-amino-4-deoxy-L-arabinose transferase-like glycosyltransferase
MDSPAMIAKPAPAKSLLLAAAAVFLLALGVRIAFAAARGVKLTPDSADYVRLAENLRAHGAYSLDPSEPFTPSIRRAPLYSFFLAPLVGAEGVSVNRAAAAQTVIDAAVAVLALLLAHAALSLRWAAAAGVAYAIHPGAIYFSTNILSEPLFTALNVAGALLLLYGLSRDRPALSALGGVAFGLATLCRPISLPLPLLLVGVSLFVAPRLPRRWLHAALLVACAALVMAPWLARCARVSGQFVLVQGYTQVIFYVATRPDWDQKDEERLWPRFAQEDPYGKRLMAARTPREVLEADRFGRQSGWQNIRARPRAYLASRARNFPHLFITSFDMFTGLNRSFGQLLRERDAPRLALKLSLLLAFSLAPLLLGVVGLAGGRRNLSAAFCAVVWVYTLLAHLPMWVEYRYWLPAVPFLLVGAAVGARLVAARLALWRTARSDKRVATDMPIGEV